MADQPVAVVTGASSGIGRAIARELAGAGYAVGLIARSPEGLEGARGDVERAGSRAHAEPTDVSDAEQVEAAASAIEEALGPIELWVNDAMVTVFARFQEVEPEEYQRATDVTYHGTVWGTRAALKRMVPRDRGTIIQVGSALAFRGIPLQAPYCGAKHAMKGFTESVITELINDGSKVHVGMVHLPGVNTPQFDHCRSKMPKHPMPVPPIYQPEICARAVLMAVRKRRRHVYVGFPTVYTIWGNRIAPWFADIYLARTAVSGQQTDKPAPRAEHDNLFEPSPGDPGAHGAFDDQAKQRSPQLWATAHRAQLLAGAGAAAVAGALALARRS